MCLRPRLVPSNLVLVVRTRDPRPHVSPPLAVCISVRPLSCSSLSVPAGPGLPLAAQLKLFGGCPRRRSSYVSFVRTKPLWGPLQVSHTHAVTSFEINCSVCQGLRGQLSVTADGDASTHPEVLLFQRMNPSPETRPDRRFHMFVGFISHE